MTHTPVSKAVWSRTWGIIILLLVLGIGGLQELQLRDLADHNAAQITCLDNTLQTRGASSSADAAAELSSALAFARWVTSVAYLFSTPPNDKAAAGQALTGFEIQTDLLRSVSAASARTLVHDAKVRAAHPYSAC